MEDTQNNASQASTNEAPLNDAQMKSGMLDAINTELDAKTTPVEKPESAETPIVEKPVVDELTDKPVKKEAVKKEVTKEDPYVMPEGLQPASQKRFQNLVDIAKQATAKVQDIEKSAKFHSETIDNFRAILEETKTSPEDLNQLLEYNRMVKSGDLEGAIKLLDEQRSQIARYLGRPIEGADYLEGFDDLKQSVQEGKITAEHAAELAKSRNIQQVIQQENDRARQTNESRSNEKKQVNSAIENITKFASDKAANDIDYKRKEEILLKSIDRIRDDSPPSTWLSQVEMLYETLSSMPPAIPNKTNTPLRPNSGGGGKPQARSMQDAIDQGLGYGAP